MSSIQSVCTSSLKYIPIAGEALPLRFCAAKACAVTLANNGVSSTDWKVALESLDLFEQISRLKITDDIPEPSRSLVSTVSKVRQSKLSEMKASLDGEINVPFFIAAAIRSRRDGDAKQRDEWETNQSSCDLLPALLAKGYGFKEAEEAAIGPVFGSTFETTWRAAMPTIADLVNRKYTTEALVEAILRYLASKDNKNFPASATLIILSVIEQGQHLELIEQKLDPVLENENHQVRAWGLAMLVQLLQHKRGMAAAERVLKKDFSLMCDAELRESLKVVAKLVECDIGLDSASQIWKCYQSHPTWFVAAAAIEILSKLVMRGIDCQEAER